ncbi:hypothetical protein B0H10DRAFT_1848814, partial [Mycena sp. CBHHK59/15]
APAFFQTLEVLITGGDIVEIRDVKEAYRLGARKIIDAYGPTEDTVWSTYYEIHPNESDFARSIPIGKSISNSRAFVLDSQHRLVPPSVVGELALGGDGVARGYTDTEITKRSFVDIVVAGERHRVYKTVARAGVWMAILR